MDLSFPLLYLLIPYVGFLLVIAMYSVFTFYHLVRFGVKGPAFFIVMGVFLAGSLILTMGSVASLAQFDWTTPVNLSSILQVPSASNLGL